MTGKEFLEDYDPQIAEVGYDNYSYTPQQVIERLDVFKQKLVNENALLHSVSNWVAIESDEQPERVTDVMVKYMDGVKEVALFDGDGRYYIEKDDRDVTDRIVEWHRLP